MRGRAIGIIFVPPPFRENGVVRPETWRLCHICPSCQTIRYCGTSLSGWVSACDTVAQLYVDVRYDPAKELAGDRFTFSFPVGSERNEPYNVGFEPYNGSDLEKKIAEALVKRFHGEGDDYEAYKGVADLDADSVGMEGTAKIWYIGRFLDGFIFDTNIDEVKQIIYGEVRKTGSAHSYDVQNPDPQWA